MTLEKLATMVDKEIRKHGFGTPPPKSDTLNVLKGLALLLDIEADPECIFRDKVNDTLDDAAYDVRNQ